MTQGNKKFLGVVLRQFNRMQVQYAKVYSQCTWLRIITNPVTIAGFIVLMLSVLNFSGSSIGMYSYYFDQGKSDPALILGKPNAIRSDEWLVNSQMLIAQKAADYPYINKNIGNGQNMSLVLDVPYKDWSIIFKPQNLIFFIAPFSFAFAFKWWSVVFILFCGAYFFTLHFLPKKKLIASILALIFCLSPFVQWWLTPGTILTLGLTFFISLIILKINETRPEKFKKKIALSISLAYLLVWFALILYPPFQIPCVIIVGVLYLATVIQDRKKKNTWISLGYIVGAGIAALFAVGLFLITRIDDVKSLLGTSYPGARVVESGGVSIVHTFSTFVGPVLQDASRAAIYSNNQSESSNFAIPYITVLLVSLVILYIDFTKRKKVNLPVLATVLIFCIFLARMVLPFGDSIYKILFLGSIPNLRLFIGLGLTSFILLILTVRYFIKEKIDFSINTRWLIVLIVTTTYSALVFAVIIKVPGLITNPVIAILLVISMSLFAWLLVNKHFFWSLVLLLAFSVISIIHIHPVYKGVDILTQNSFSQFISNQHTKDPGGRWAVNENIQLENIAIINGAPSLTGVYVLPQNKLFSDLVPSVDNSSTNRYAHVQFHFDEAITKPSIKLLQADSFIVNINPCSPQLEKYNLRYIISTISLTSSCTTEIFNYPTMKMDPTNIFVYKIQH